MDEEPTSQQTYDSLALDSCRELERLQLQHGGTTEEPDKRLKMEFPLDVIVAIIEHADTKTLCTLARVSRDVGNHALRQLYTPLDLSEWDWELVTETMDWFPYETSLVKISGIGEGVLAFLRGTDSEIAPKRLKLGASPLLRYLYLWATGAIGERWPVLKYIASVKAITCTQGLEVGNGPSHPLKAIPSELISGFTHLSIAQPTLKSVWDGRTFSTRLANLAIRDLCVVTPTIPLFDSTSPFEDSLSTLYLSSGWHSSLISQSIVTSLKNLHALRLLCLQHVDTNPKFGVDETLGGILGVRVVFPLLEDISLGIIVEPSVTPETVIFGLLGWIGGCGERLRWPYIREIKWRFLPPGTYDSGYHIEPEALLMKQIKAALSASGYSTSRYYSGVFGSKCNFYNLPSHVCKELA